MIKNIIDKISAPFRGSPLEYGVVQTDVLSQVQMGKNTPDFVRATAGDYAEFLFADYFNGGTEFQVTGKNNGPNDIYDGSGKGWEVKARNFRRYVSTQTGKRCVPTNVAFCSSTQAVRHHRPSEQDHLNSITEKFNACEGIVVVDHQYLHINGVCRYWKISSRQVFALYEEKLWKGKRLKSNGAFGKIAQCKRLKSAQSFVATMSSVFQTNFKKSFPDFPLEDWMPDVVYS